MKTMLPKIIAGIFFSSAVLFATAGHDSVSAANSATVKKMKCTHVSVKTISPDTAKQKASLPSVARDTLIVIARCIEIPGKFAANDLYNYVYIMKYRVVKVVRGDYPAQELLVGHYNPLIPRKQIKDKMSAFARGDVTKFQTGDKHRLVLIKPIERVWKDAVEDEYSDSDLDKYYALRADCAP